MRRITFFITVFWSIAFMMHTAPIFGQSAAQSSASFSEEDVVFYVGEGEKTAYIIVDFRDESPDASFSWGVRFDEGENLSVVDALDFIQTEDANFSYMETGGFLNDIIYNHHEGLDSMPDWWSTWSGPDLDSLEMNSGISETLTENHWYGFSYGFTPEPVAPAFKYAAYNVDWLDFSEVEDWYGEGEHQTIITIDFVEDEEAEEVTLAWGLRFEEDSLSGKQALETLADLDDNLSITYSSDDELTGVTYQELERNATTDESWRHFTGNTLSDYVPIESDSLAIIGDQQLFGVSFGNEHVRRPYIPVFVEIEDLGVEDFSDISFKVWPNPVQDELNIESTEETEEIRIFYFSGRKVISTSDKTISVDHLQTGNYIIEIQTENQLSRKQFIKN